MYVCVLIVIHCACVSLLPLKLIKSISVCHFKCGVLEKSPVVFFRTLNIIIIIIIFKCT